MADDGRHGGPAAQFALDLQRHPSLLPRDEDPELVVGRRAVAAVAFVDEDARDGVVDERVHVWNHRCQRVAIIWIAGQRLHMGDAWAAAERLRQSLPHRDSRSYDL